MKKQIFCLLILVSSLTEINLHATTLRHDLDLDGIPDIIDLSPLKIGKDQASKQKISIILSRGKNNTPGILESESGNIDVYPGTSAGELIIDYSVRSSRDSSELNYDVYQWSKMNETLCLHASVTGTPPNQLENELLPTDVKIRLFEDCSRVGAVPSRRIVMKSLPRLDDQKSWVANYMKRKIPEWIALELSARMSAPLMEDIKKIANYQANIGNPAGAAILYRSVIKINPKDSQVASSLAHIYNESGDIKNACAVYILLSKEGELDKDNKDHAAEMGCSH
ncbi:tetratricopeptide repeat protein [Cupriavidus sp. 30B13]|uniref:tetratricopeptide repeat protein n=1 Tax=Cupriavidus sp. 30B13 TaxID=3384241 RepID=UPI003B90B40E